MSTWGISALIGKRVEDDDDSALKEHLLFCNYARNFEDFSILATNNNDRNVTSMGSLLINWDHPLLNKNKQSLPLEFFTVKCHHIIRSEIYSFCCSSFILRVVLVSHEFYIKLIVGCYFIRFHLIVILKQKVDFSFKV